MEVFFRAPSVAKVSLFADLSAWHLCCTFVIRYVTIYNISFFDITNSARSGRSALWQCIYFLCVSLALIPAHLLEPRYYIVPFIVLQLHIFPCQVATVHDWRLTACFLMQILVAIAINLTTGYTFLWRPFMDADGQTARWIY